jgi:glycosyltransferase involved in cell wall biosynthesis
MKEFVRVNESYRPSFRYVILRGLRLVEYNYFSPLLAFWLLRDRYDGYIGSPLSSIDCLITFLVAKLLRKPFILWDERWQSSRSILSRLIEPVQFMMARKAQVVVVPGLKSLEYFRTRVLEQDSTQLTIAPNASVLNKPSSLSVERFRRLHGIPEHRKVVVYLGRLSPEKGVDFLLRSQAILEQEFGDGVFLLIAGEGEEQEKLRSLADALGLHSVKFTCSHIYEQAECLCVADVVVLPSTGRRTAHSEVWGMVINEAASLGKPVVATDAVGCAGDLIAKYQCGYLVKSEDSDELYRAIRDLLVHPMFALQTGANGIRATKAAFSYEKMAEAFDRAVQQVFGNPLLKER